MSDVTELLRQIESGQLAAVDQISFSIVRKTSVAFRPAKVAFSILSRSERRQ